MGECSGKKSGTPGPLVLVVCSIGGTSCDIGCAAVAISSPVPVHQSTFPSPAGRWSRISIKFVAESNQSVVSQSETPVFVYSMLRHRTVVGRT